jgi:hypothetical protein
VAGAITSKPLLLKVVLALVEKKEVGLGSGRDALA